VPWPDAPYTYFANNARLDRVLAEFASSFSLSLSLAPGFSSGPAAPTGGAPQLNASAGPLGTALVNGRFNTKNPTEFIGRLAGVYGFTWYTHAGTLFVSRASDVVVRPVSAGTGNIASLRQALTDMGVLDTRFGWGEIPEQGVAMVTGPASYVALVESTVRSLPTIPGGQQVMVFRLKHAQVDDRSIFFRDKEITTPGLATILRNLILGIGATGRGGVNNEALSALAAPLRDNPPVISNGASTAPPAATGPQAGSSAGGTSNVGTAQGGGAANRPSGGATGGGQGSGQQAIRTRQASIQADPRLNALIVQDIPERMPIYERLIAQLDVPTPLVEIEAMIVDVNSQRLSELGINWGGRRSGTAAGFGNLNAAASAAQINVVRAPRATTAIDPSTVVANVGNYLVAQLRLLESLGDARIQSRPSVLTVENVGAILDLSETFFIRVTGERVASVTPVTAGTTLRVTPRVIESSERPGERNVLLVVDIEDGQIQDRTIDTLPTVRRSSVSTQAVILENDTLLIGGYNSSQNIERINRVPGLGAIPGVGMLFSNSTIDVQQRERLFLIRPRIVGTTSSPLLPIAAQTLPSIEQPPSPAQAPAAPSTAPTPPAP
jgi:type III secretion protein C